MQTPHLDPERTAELLSEARRSGWFPEDPIAQLISSEALLYLRLAGLEIDLRTESGASLLSAMCALLTQGLQVGYASPREISSADHG